MNLQETNKLINILRKDYPDAKCSLDFNYPFELVVAVMLSAQCTDERVNKITPTLFNRCKTILDYAQIDLDELEDIIHPCGFYKNKARNIKLCAKQILDNFDGNVPNDMDSLLTLAGIGRKSANVIQLEVFGIANGIAVDTHCKRLSNRLGISNETEPNKIEQDILKLYDSSYYFDINHIFIWHGRNICKSQNPECDKCQISSYCKYYKTQKKGIKK